MDPKLRQFLSRKQNENGPKELSPCSGGGYSPACRPAVFQ
jgi:hypothetical protein